MNNTKAKLIRKQVKFILVEWMHTLLEDKEAAKINVSNVFNYLPEQTHYYSTTTLHLNSYHPKWISNKIKQLLKSKPHLNIQDINLELIQWKMN
tara:strand:+ start:5296 stop:5577 length:282 start_codon:yes stop_codon:yes gene_type:complete